MTNQDTNLTPFEHTRRALHRAIDRIIDAWPQALIDADARGFGSGGSRVGGRSSDHPDPTCSAALRPDHAVAWLAELGDVAAAVWANAGVSPVSLSYLWHRGTEVRSLLHDAVERLCESWTIDDLIDADPQSNNYGRDVFGLERLADDASRWWPPPPRRGQTVGGVSVGERGNQVEDCGLCGMPAPGGRNEAGQLLVRRIDGVAYHATAGPGRSACWWTVWRQRRRVA